MLIRYLTASLRLPLLAICTPVALPAQMEEVPQGYTCYRGPGWTLSHSRSYFMASLISPAAAIALSTSRDNAFAC
jgi:hypothetical protein